MTRVKGSLSEEKSSTGINTSGYLCQMLHVKLIFHPKTGS